MGYKVDNAIIMAAGISSRFAPLSYEKPKALITVRGEVLIERQIRQLQNAGIKDIVVVVGYKKEDFKYLVEKYGIQIVENPEYSVRNNNSSIKAVEKYLRNSYICSSDNYFIDNPFEKEVDEAYYAAVYSPGETKEWCIAYDESGWITDVKIGGLGQWYMLGHVFWNEVFSQRFLRILNKVYDEPETADMLWESIYLRHLDELKLKIRKYPDNYIFEFDSLDELRLFDKSYYKQSGSSIMQRISFELNCNEEDIVNCEPIKGISGKVMGFTFMCKGRCYNFDYITNKLICN